MITVPTDSLMEMICLQLEKGGKASLTVTGTSMLPMLRQNYDSVLLVTADRPLKAGEIALYRNSNGKYILHRVICVTPEGYLFCGDNQAHRELVTDDQVIGVVTEFTKKGKRHTLTELWYRLYVFGFTNFFWLRKYYITLRRRLGCLRKYLRTGGK